MKTSMVSGKERPFPSPGLNTGEPGSVKVELMIVFDPRGGYTTRVTSCEVTRVDPANPDQV